MSAHLFYLADLQQKDIEFDEEASKHMAVLRLQPGDAIHVTDGKGHIATAHVVSGHRKRITAQVAEKNFTPQMHRQVAMAVSLTKNTARFEWFLEKATELGVGHIIPLVCARTEKQKLRMDRMHNILVSAMLQSKQLWLPRLDEPMLFKDVCQLPAEQKLIAHCALQQKSRLQECNGTQSSLLLIGPEGDFTSEEIQLALSHGFKPVSIGSTRLRTETAAVTGAAWLMLTGAHE